MTTLETTGAVIWAPPATIGVSGGRHRAEGRRTKLTWRRMFYMARHLRLY